MLDGLGLGSVSVLSTTDRRRFCALAGLPPVCLLSVQRERPLWNSQGRRLVPPFCMRRVHTNRAGGFRCYSSLSDRSVAGGETTASSYGPPLLERVAIKPKTHGKAHGAEEWPHDEQTCTHDGPPQLLPAGGGGWSYWKGAGGGGSSSSSAAAAAAAGAGTAAAGAAGAAAGAAGAAAAAAAGAAAAGARATSSTGSEGCRSLATTMPVRGLSGLMGCHLRTVFNARASVAPTQPTREPHARASV